MKLTNDLDPYARDQKGRWKKKTRWEFVIFWVFFIGTVGAYIGHVNARTDQNIIRSTQSADRANEDTKEMGDIHTENDMDAGYCTKTPDGSCSFATKENLLKWRTFLKSEVEKLKVEAGKPTAILTKVCRTNGITDSNCPKILYAMAEHESYFGEQMSGDGGLSHGYFHIMYYHEVPKSCSEDLECSADWTLKRMISKGFNENRDNAIRRHNGGLTNPKTLKYLHDVKAKMALWPNG